MQLHKMKNKQKLASQENLFQVSTELGRSIEENAEG